MHRKPATHRLILAIFSLLLSIETLDAQSFEGTAFRKLPGVTFVLVSEDSEATPPHLSDSLFDAVAQGVRFKVNSTDLQKSDPFAALYLEQVVPWLKSQDMKLGQIYVKGAASPEGSYLNNVRLSRARTQRLIEFLCKDLGQPCEGVPISAQSVTEDYGLLVKMMQEADDPDYERVNALWLTCNGDEACCKQKLRALDNGKVWNRLLHQYFPALRQARVVLWFVRKEESRKPALEIISAKPWYTLLAVPATGMIPQKPVSAPVVAETPERQRLMAVRTNLVHDFLYVPQFGFAPGGNLQLEYFPSKGHYTFNAGFTFTNHRRWSEYKFFQIRDLQLEVRRYFKGKAAFKGPYVGVYAEGTIYGIGFGKTKGWEGEGGGGGLSLGWTWALNRKGNLRLEISANLGVFVTRYDPYVYGNPLTGEEDGLYYYDYHGNSSEFKPRNYIFTWFGPTNAGIHLTYDILYRKKK